MSDIVKGVISGFWPLIVGWIFPAALTLAVFGLVVLPVLATWPGFDELNGASPGAQALVLLVSSVLVGWLLASLQTPLYRVLEGYLLWPTAVRTAAIQRHAKKKARQWCVYRSKPEGLEKGLALEAVLRYPSDDAQIAPTMLGNAIRRFEVYGQDRYNLDSQFLWYQLHASVPDGLNKDVQAAQASVDFFVSFAYLSTLLGAVSVIALFADPGEWLRVVAVAVGSSLVAVGGYRGAISATDGWAASVRAMVDLGRTGLASTFGLAMPQRLEDERRMWEALGWLTVFPYTEEAGRAIDEFRQG